MGLPRECQCGFIGPEIGRAKSCRPLITRIVRGRHGGMESSKETGKCKIYLFFFEFLNFIYFLYSRFLLAIYFIHISVYMSIPISQFIPPPPPPLISVPPWCPYVCSLHLCLYFCPADRFICTIFLGSTYMH